MSTVSSARQGNKMEKSMFPAKLSPPSCLPPEILEIILSKLVKPTDLLNAINASQAWREILSSRKGELFPLVLQVPALVDHLRFSTLLTCRQVTTRTKAAVDSTLQLHTPAHPQIYFSENVPSCRKVFQKISNKLEENSFTFDEEERCEKFLKKMGHHETECNFNPFILGCVRVNISKNFSNYCNQLIAMFQKYGKFVFSLKMSFGRGFASQVGVLLTILECLPNLRHLEVRTEPDLYFFLSWPCHFQEIYEWIQECQLPQLMSLNVTRCRTLIGRGEMEYWDDWEEWKDKPKTVEGALYRRYQDQLVVVHL